MKKILFPLLLLLTTSLTVWAQAPQRLSYQSIVRDGSNVVVASTAVGIKISVVRGTATGPAVYVETHRKTTNTNGLVSLEIGEGTVLTGRFVDIDWANGPYLIRTETDPTGGTNYSITGIAPLNSVPYALYAANGTPGPKGDKGDTGATGTTGAAGLPGVAGPAGVQGPIGLTGLQGPAGPQGVVGLPGEPGLAGAIGPQGPIGLTGPAGLPGATGAQGPIGLTGLPGAVGQTGPQGLPGVAGSQGPSGPQGLPGVAGPAGPIGPAGAVGPQGQIGLTGLTGATGAQGPIGLTGPAGLQGPVGLTGPVGSTGLQGPAGPAGTNGVSASSANFVDLTTNQNIAGVKTFSGNIAMGTSTPSAKLEIVGGTRNDMLRLVSDGNPSVSFKNTDPSGGTANDGEYQLFAAGDAGNPSIDPGTFGIYYDHGSNAGYRLGITNTGNVGIGTAKPTAKLDVAGNLKTSGTIAAGTVTYPNAHGTSGQVLSTTGTGALSWVTPASSSSGTHTIGEAFGGGIVFYTWDNGAHGLIVALHTIGKEGPQNFSPTDGLTWGPNNITVGAFRTGVGAGLQNTDLMLAKIPTPANQQYFDYAQSATGHYSAFTAQQYTSYTQGQVPGSAFGDWYLPSLGELRLLYENRNLISGSGYDINRSYWSSTETNAAYAYQISVGGGIGWDVKTNLRYVLPIRKF